MSVKDEKCRTRERQGRVSGGCQDMGGPGLPRSAVWPVPGQSEVRLKGGVRRFVVGLGKCAQCNISKLVSASALSA